MSQIFQLTDKIGDVVAKLPKAAEIFSRHGIDFCCGGQRPLAEAIAELSLDSQVIINELDAASKEAQALGRGAPDWRTESLSKLIDYIINTHHTYLRKSLPELSEMTTAILRAHGASHKELSRVHRLFHMLKLELEQHLITEEEVLFPVIKEYEKTGAKDVLNEAQETIEQLEREHEGAGDILKELRQITAEYTLPTEACVTYERSFRQLQELEADLFQHIHLENNILHPRVMAEKA